MRETKYLLVDILKTQIYRNMRKKRKVQPIPIENAKPHKVTSREYQASTTHAPFKIADMLELSQLIELQDDEVCRLWVRSDWDELILFGGLTNPPENLR